jgi:hypothetical protein
MKYTINELANSKGVSQPVREALLHMEAELDATNRQVEILSDALAESQREVAALKAVQEPVAWAHKEGLEKINDFDASIYARGGFDDAVPLYTTPLAQPAPVQVSPLEFVTMVMEKEHLVGKPLFWAEWPNKENT